MTAAERAGQQQATLTRFPLPPVEQVVDGHSEPFGLFLTGKVQTDLTALRRREARFATKTSSSHSFMTTALGSACLDTYVSCKGDEVGPGAADGEVVVELLFKHGLPFLQEQIRDTLRRGFFLNQ